MKCTNEMLIVTNSYSFEGKEALLLGSQHLKSITWNRPEKRWKHLPVTQARTRGEIAHLKNIQNHHVTLYFVPL